MGKTATLHHPKADTKTELLWYDPFARWLTSRAPRMVGRVVIRAHRWLVRERLIPVHMPGFHLAVSPQDNLGHHLFYYGSYESSQVELWNQLLSRGQNMVVLDVGANVGYYSLFAAARANVHRVLSFEPNPLVLPTLRYNAGLNERFADKITVADVAVGDTNGTVHFYRNFESHNFGLGSMRSQTMDPVTVDVPIVRLDSYLASQGVDRVDLIKIDVEGAEHSVVTGLEGWWSRHTRPTIVVEVHPMMLPDFDSSVHALLATLTKAGYRLQRLRPDGELEPANDRFNAISWVLAEPA